MFECNTSILIVNRYLKRQERKKNTQTSATVTYKHNKHDTFFLFRVIDTELLCYCSLHICSLVRHVVKSMIV